MSRPYSTALLAVVIATFAIGTADAKSKSTPPSPIVATALQSGSQSISEEVGRVTSPSESQAFVVPADVRERLRALETASSMPNAKADLAMWSGTNAAAVTRAATESESVAVVGSKKADTMHRFARGIISRTSSIAMSLTRSAMRFIGTPYVFGGTSPSGFDCSGYTQHVFAMLGIQLPRLADAQYYAGHKIVGGMTTGDLVFFQTYEPGPSHVGIYVGAGKFIHSSSHGVMISRLGDSYWRARYIGAKRVVASR